MKEFILNHKQWVAAYTGLWFLTAAGFCVVLFEYVQFGFERSLKDAIISASLFYIIAPALWYVIRFSGKKSSSVFSTLPASLLAGLLIVMAWLYFSKLLIGVVLQHDAAYLAFINDSLSMRAIAGATLMALVYLLFQVFLLQQINAEAHQREEHLEELVRKTELHALKNQLNPHFIYNSLNSISSLTHTKPEKAREMILILSDFLRYALKQDALQLTTLEKELENVKLYLSMEMLRFGNKLSIEWENLSSAYSNQAIPVMLLQPLVENAIKHGVQSRSGTVVVKIFIEDTGGPALTVSVSNPYDSHFAKYKGEGVGLEIIRNRLRLIYGNGKLLNISATPELFTASISLPKTQHDG